MALVIPPGYAQCALRFSLAGDPEPIFVTFGVNPPADPDWNAVATRVQQAWTATGGPQGWISNQYTLSGINLYVGQDGGTPIVVEKTVSVGSAQTEQPLPQNCAILVRKRSLLGGRSNRGRMYVPGFSEAKTSPAGVVDATAVTGLATTFTKFLEDLAAAGGGSSGLNDTPAPMVILHSLTADPNETYNPTPVASLNIDNRIATQRRRLRR